MWLKLETGILLMLLLFSVLGDRETERRESEQRETIETEREETKMKVANNVGGKHCREEV